MSNRSDPAACLIDVLHGDELLGPSEPGVSSNAVVARRTVSDFLPDGRTGEIILQTRVLSRDRICWISVSITWSSVNNFAQIVEAKSLWRDECVATQSITKFCQCFNVLITSFTSNALSSAKFPFMETCCVSVTDFCTSTRIGMISSGVTQV